MYPVFQESRKELWLGMEVWNVVTGILEQRKVKPRFSDARLIQTPRYYGQFGLSQGKESPFIFSKFNPLNGTQGPPQCHRMKWNTYGVVQFYPRKFYLLFQTYYHTLPYPTTKENKI